MNLNEQKSGCLICGSEIVYLSSPRDGKCVYCNQEFLVNEHCTNGHYVCDKCHSSGAMDIIEQFCMKSESTDPLDMANILMLHPSVKMHGPEHHYLVPAVLLTAYYNILNKSDDLENKLNKARKRAESVPGGFCGTHGNCGAGVGTGIFISLITGSSPLAKDEWKLSNLMTSRSLEQIAIHGGPRCCKRDTYLSLMTASDFLKEYLEVNLPVNKNIVCNFEKFNKECLKEKCLFYKTNGINKMNTNEELKEIVRSKYSEIAIASQSCGCSCCGTDSGATVDYTVMSDDYAKLDGYVPEADLGLGCGLPTEHAGIKEGDTVLDLGSGAGNDVFIARREVGENGKVIGLDFTDAMIEKARKKCDVLGYNNVEFRKGDIENIPIGSSTVDVIISNCVLNLVPDKQKAFSEMYRVLKSSGHFCVSDIVTTGDLPENLKSAAAMYTGCVAGALIREDYLKIISDSGFRDVSVPKEKRINIPDEIILNFISKDELEGLKNSGVEIISVTVNAYK